MTGTSATTRTSILNDNSGIVGSCKVTCGVYDTFLFCFETEPDIRKVFLVVEHLFQTLCKLCGRFNFLCLSLLYA